jgi:holo-[acyl-carrier protein] synthase
MRIVGYGIDMVSVTAIRAQLESPNKRWAEQFCSDAERAQADPPPIHSRYFAGRFAAKEAVVKALGTGFAGEITWRNIEILRGASGAPTVYLSDKVKSYATMLGVTDWFISISHCGDTSLASALAMGNDL